MQQQSAYLMAIFTGPLFKIRRRRKGEKNNKSAENIKNSAEDRHFSTNAQSDR